MNKAARTLKIWAETNGHCAYCNRMTPPEKRTLDHAYPRSRGGTWQSENLIPACEDCNNYKGAKMPASRFACTEWLDYVKYKEGHIQRKREKARA